MTLGKNTEAVVGGYLGFKGKVSLRSSCHLLPPHLCCPGNPQALSCKLNYWTGWCEKQALVVFYRQKDNSALDWFRIHNQSATAAEEVKLGKPIHDGRRAAISRRKAAKTRCCPRLVKEPPQQCQMHLDRASHCCLWWMWLPLPSCLSSPPGRDGCPPSKGSRRKDMSALHLLLSGGRNSQEFAETKPALDAKHCLTSSLNPGFSGITYLGMATPLTFPGCWRG